MGKTFFKKILVLIDGRQSSIHTAMYAIMMAKTYNLALKFLYVVDTATIKYLTMNRFLISEESHKFEGSLHEDGTNYLNYVEKLAISKGVNCEKELKNGGVFTEVIKCAEEYEADLILLGGVEKSSNKFGFKKSYLSPNQNEIINNSKCPVLIIQKPEIEDEFKIFK